MKYFNFADSVWGLNLEENTKKLYQFYIYLDFLEGKLQMASDLIRIWICEYVMSRSGNM